MATVDYTQKPRRDTDLHEESLPLQLQDVTAEPCSEMLDGARVEKVETVSAEYGSAPSLGVEPKYDDGEYPYYVPYSPDSPKSEAAFDSLETHDSLDCLASLDFLDPLDTLDTLDSHESLDAMYTWYPHFPRLAQPSVPSASCSSSQLSRSPRPSVSSTTTAPPFSSFSTLIQSCLSRVFLKGGLSPDVAGSAPSLQATYRREAESYHHLAPQLRNAGVRLPESYSTDVDVANGQRIVVLEKITARGCTFGKPEQPLFVDQVHADVEQLAMIHAAIWSKCLGTNTFP